jgi:hypothetical protein
MTHLSWDRAVSTGLDTVERMARKILRTHPELDEFIMNGFVIFTRKDGQPCSDAYLDELNAFLDEWDQYLFLSLFPMRFTAYSRKVTKW